MHQACIKLHQAAPSRTNLHVGMYLLDVINMLKTADLVWFLFCCFESILSNYMDQLTQPWKILNWCCFLARVYWRFCLVFTVFFCQTTRVPLLNEPTQWILDPMSRICLTTLNVCIEEFMENNSSCKSFHGMEYCHHIILIQNEWNWERNKTCCNQVYLIL